MPLILATLSISFFLNFIWEELHSVLYVHHLGEQITHQMLLVATIGDVLILSLFALLWYFIPFFNKNLWSFIPLGLLVAYAIEKYAFATHRWAYTEAMPIVPILNVGLSPFLQLAVTTVILLLCLKIIKKPLT